MELHQLRYFMAVVDTGSFTAAAQVCRVSQSGISTQVQKLERELGVALFHRTGRRAIITPEGERLSLAARHALSSLDEVRATADALRGLIIGTLRIGTVSGLEWAPLFDALAELHTAHPGLDTRLHEATSDDLIASLLRGESDVVVAAWSSRLPEGLESSVIVDDPLVAVVSAQHPWASRTSVQPHELLSIPLIVLPRGTAARAAAESVLEDAGQAVEPRWEVSSPAFVRMLSARGLGVGIVSRTTCSDWEGTHAVGIDAPSARSRLGVLWRASPTHAARALLARLPTP